MSVNILGTNYDINSTKCLFLFANKLEYIPSGVFMLKNLTHLHLTNNNIKEIPPEIEQLTKLEILYASINNITHIPKEILNLQNLKVLTVSDNPLKGLTVTKNENNLEEVKEFLQKNINNNTRSQAESRIQSFISNHVIPKYYDFEADFMNLSI